MRKYILIILLIVLLGGCNTNTVDNKQLDNTGEEIILSKEEYDSEDTTYITDELRVENRITPKQSENRRQLDKDAQLIIDFILENPDTKSSDRSIGNNYNKLLESGNLNRYFTEFMYHGYNRAVHISPSTPAGYIDNRMADDIKHDILTNTDYLTHRATNLIMPEELALKTPEDIVRVYIVSDHQWTGGAYIPSFIFIDKVYGYMSDSSHHTVDLAEEQDVKLHEMIVNTDMLSWGADTNNLNSSSDGEGISVSVEFSDGKVAQFQVTYKWDFENNYAMIDDPKGAKDLYNYVYETTVYFDSEQDIVSPPKK